MKLSSCSATAECIYDAQLNPLPHEDCPQGRPEDEDEDLPEAEKTDRSRDTFSEPHLGQTTLGSLAETSSSNLSSHSEHLYSNSGIFDSYETFISLNDMTAPVTTPTTVHG